MILGGRIKFRTAWDADANAVYFNARFREFDFHCVPTFGEGSELAGVTDDIADDGNSRHDGNGRLKNNEEGN